MSLKIGHADAHPVVPTCCACGGALAWQACWRCGGEGTLDHFGTPALPEGAIPGVRGETMDRDEDGGHHAHEVKADVLAWRPAVRPGGLLAGHDRNVDGVPLALAEALPQGYTVPADTIWEAR